MILLLMQSLPIGRRIPGPLIHDLVTNAKFTHWKKDLTLGSRTEPLVEKEFKLFIAFTTLCAKIPTRYTGIIHKGVLLLQEFPSFFYIIIAFTWNMSLSVNGFNQFHSQRRKLKLFN